MIERSFREAYGQYCWGVTWDRQTDLWLQFGAPHLDVREPLQAAGGTPRVRRLFRYRRVSARGAWAFAVLAAHWRLELPDGPPVTGATRSARARTQALACLSGQRLVAAAVDPGTAATRLDFDLGAALHVRRAAPDEPDEMWLLYRPSGYVLAVRGSGEYDHRPGNGRREPRWRPIPAMRADA